MKNSSAVSPCSRVPTPVPLEPPNGIWASPPGVPLLTCTMPVSMCSTNRKSLAGSPVKIEDERPNFTPLAASMASSKPGTRMTETTGPKISSWAMRVDARTWSNTVGST